MKNLWKCAAGLCAVMALGLSTANAQTVMNGPYYATPSWDQTLPPATRFVVLSNFNNEAVLDRETGLVWARSPETLDQDWDQAWKQCAFVKTTGNRKGWRLPAVQELLSLVDASVNSPDSSLPPGHPFIYVPDKIYWSTTPTTDGPNTLIYSISFGFKGIWYNSYKNNPYFRAWCVRGGQSSNVQ